jgi:hypothetical protein
VTGSQAKVGSVKALTAWKIYFFSAGWFGSGARTTGTG